MTALSKIVIDRLRPVDRPSIAVLPFNDLGGAPAERYFTDGVTEDIVVELSRFHDIQVIAPSSSFACEPFAGDIGRVARELDVRYVLEGGIRRAAGRLRVTAQLIDAKGGDRVWTDRHDESEGDVFELQASIAARIVGSLVPEIHHAEQYRAERHSAGNPHAYELALKASACIHHAVVSTDQAALQDGIAMAEEAVALDPLCQRAHYAVAFGYCRRAALGFFGMETGDDLARADAAALRLRELDEGNHAAYAILGHIAMRRLQHGAALTNLRRAHELNPNDVTTLRWLAWVEANFGMATEAREHAALSLRLSPRDRAIDQSHWTLALACYVDRDYPACVLHAKQAIALNPQFNGHRILLAACLAEMGEMTEAADAAATLMRLAPGLIRSRLAGRTHFADPALASRYQRALTLAAGLSTPEPARACTRPAPRRAAAENAPSIAGLLTERECQVLRGVAAGGSNGEIAVRLRLSEHTVKRHLANIMCKLDLPTRAAAVAAAARSGLL